MRYLSTITNLRSLVVLAALAVFMANAHSATGQEGVSDAGETNRFDSVVQIQAILESIDYFAQFTWGDDIFERYLLMMLLLETADFAEGEGLVYESRIRRDESGVETTRIERALLIETEEGHRWWSLATENETQDIYVEILAAETGLPLEIRYNHPVTGRIHTRTPVFSAGYEEAAAQYGMEVMRSAVRDLVAEDLERLRRRVSNPDLKGDETILIGPGVFDALRFHERIDGGEVDYWFSSSPDASLLHLLITADDGTEVLRTELVELTEGKVQLFDTVSLVSDAPIDFYDEEPSEALISEGSIDDPIVLDAGTSYEGSVADGEMSYYAIHILKRCDIEITVYDYAGSVELVYFAGDSSFTDWTTSSAGSEPDIQDFYLDGGYHGYFTIADLDEEDGLGEAYTISTEPNFLLDPIGISIRGEIYDAAERIATDEPIQAELGNEALHYFETLVPKGGSLRIEARDLPNGAGLRWYGTATGSFGSAYWKKLEHSEVIEVSGLPEGSVCYYYVVGEPDSPDSGVIFTIHTETNHQ